MARCFDSQLINYSNYHAYLRSNHFSGVSGLIQFSKNQSNDRMNSTSYTLSNLQLKRPESSLEQAKLTFESVMTWSEADCHWSDDLTMNRTHIVWPGPVTASRPTDYPVLRGEQLLHATDQYSSNANECHLSREGSDYVIVEIIAWIRFIVFLRLQVHCCVFLWWTRLLSSSYTIRRCKIMLLTRE